MKKRGATDWFLDLPPEISATIAIGHRDSKFWAVICEWLRGVIFLTLFLTLLNLATSGNETEMQKSPSADEHTNSTLFFLYLFVILGLAARMMMGFICIFLPQILKNAVYVNFVRLTEDDLFKVLCRPDINEIRLDVRATSRFIIKDCLKRLVRIAGIIVILIAALPLVIFIFERL